MIRIAVVDTSQIYCEGLAAILREVPDVVLVGMANIEADPIRCTRDGDAQLVLLDGTMPDGPAIVRGLLKAVPHVRVIALGIPETEPQILDFAEAGIAGYLSPTASQNDLVTTIRAVARGETPCSPRVAAVLLRRVSTLALARQVGDLGNHLTPREVEIVRLVERGLSNKEIARELSIEVRTVKNHVHNILEKLQVHRRGEAAARLRGARPLASGA